jgi:pimeloyl-ACP methyl ester carboxylesterase
MNPRLFLALLGFICAACLPAAESAPVTPIAPATPAANVATAVKQPVLVSVHGAWAGGWQFKRTAVILEAHGWKVYRPSMSGLGEHFNTARPDIGLATHIDDIVNFILFEDLHDVILLGHSYGGMVITGVADRIPERISRVIYLDAFLPENGESVMSLRKPGALPIEQMEKDGYIIPNWVKPGKPFPIDVPHPVKTFTDPIVLKNQAVAQKLPTTYILTVDPGKKPEDDDFYAASERAKARGWPVIIMEADHVPMWRKPEETARLLESIH